MEHEQFTITRNGRPSSASLDQPVGVTLLSAVLHLVMPTTRPRHVITETDDVARALDDAARRWPAERGNRRKLLLRLMEEGHRAIGDRDASGADARRAAVERTSGALTGSYGEDYLTDLRADWPE